MVSAPTLLRRATLAYTWHLVAAVGIFTIGILAGVGLVVGGVDLLAVIGIEDVTELFPEELTTVGIFVNNLQASLLMVLSGLTLGLLTAFALFANGVVVGYVATPAVAETGLFGTLLLLVPHGIFELPAVFIAAAIGFWIAVVLTDRIRGRREDLRPDSEEQRRLGALGGTAVLLLGVAAVVEVHVTPALFETVYGADPGGR